MPDEGFNPYIPPVSDLTQKRFEGGLSERAAMLKHEASIHSVALAFFGLGVLLVCAGVVALRQSIVPASIAFAAITLGALDLIIDSGLRRYWKPAQIAAVVVSTLSVFVFPVYLLVALYVIPTLINRQARQVFTNEYRAVIAATPHLSVPTSRAPRVIILVLGIAFAVIALASMLGR